MVAPWNMMSTYKLMLSIISWYIIQDIPLHAWTCPPWLSYILVDNPHWLSLYHHHQTLKKHPISLVLDQFLSTFRPSMSKTPSDWLWIQVLRSTFSRFVLVTLFDLHMLLSVTDDGLCLFKYLDSQIWSQDLPDIRHHHHLYPSCRTLVAFLPFVVDWSWQRRWNFVVHLLTCFYEEFALFHVTDRMIHEVEMRFTYWCHVYKVKDEKER